MISPPRLHKPTSIRHQLMFLTPLHPFLCHLAPAIAPIGYRFLILFLILLHFFYCCACHALPSPWPLSFQRRDGPTSRRSLFVHFPVQPFHWFNQHTYLFLFWVAGSHASISLITLNLPLIYVTALPWTVQNSPQRPPLGAVGWEPVKTAHPWHGWANGKIAAP